MYEKESGSEPEEEESECISEETEEIEEPKEKNAQKRKNIFEYLNNNAKRNKP